MDQVRSNKETLNLLGNRKCAAVIRTTGPTDISSYYEIWESIVAITGVCVRRGLVGTALPIGKICSSFSMSLLLHYIVANAALTDRLGFFPQ